MRTTSPWSSPIDFVVLSHHHGEHFDEVAGILLTRDASQGAHALKAVRPRSAMPIHYDDYPVFKSPIEDFKQAAAAARSSTEIHHVARGGTHHFEMAR